MSKRLPSDCEEENPLIQQGVELFGQVDAAADRSSDDSGCGQDSTLHLTITPTETSATTKPRCRPRSGVLGALALTLVCAIAAAVARWYSSYHPLEWDDSAVVATIDRDSVAAEDADIASEGCASGTEEWCRPLNGGQLRHLLKECSRRLQLPGDHCGTEDRSMTGNSYHVPFMGTDGLPCGFETLVNKGVMEELASKFVFRFVGASTTRRLAESFVSIFTELGSNHVVYHERRDYSVANLKVIFDWAPVCAGEDGIGTLVATAMDEERANRHNKRVVFVTAFGVHDATRIHEYQEQELSVIAPGGNATAAYELYTTARQERALAKDDFSIASLESCRVLTSELDRLAAEGERPSQQQPWHGRRATEIADRGLREEARRGQEAVGSSANGRAVMAGDGHRPRSGGGSALQWDHRGRFVAAAAAAAAAEEDASGSAAAQQKTEGLFQGSEDRTAIEMREGDGGARRLGIDGSVGGNGGIDGSAGGNGGSNRVSRSRARRRGLGVKSGWRAWWGSEDTATRDEAEEVDVSAMDPPPLVFLFQGNPFKGEDPRDAWLADLHSAQDEEIEKESARRRGGNVSPSDRGGVFLVDDRVSLYGGMSCYRKDDIHFFEPVKLIEGKMLWHLLTLVNREGAS